MPTNTDPIFSGSILAYLGPNVTAANTAMDGTGAVAVVFTAGATDGGFLEEISLKPRGTNVASVARFFLNNGGDNNTAANNSLLFEITLPATTLSQTSATIELGRYVGKALAPGQRILMTLGTAVAAGWQATSFGGSFTKT